MGMKSRDNAPASVVTIAITIASLGLSTKIEESTDYLLGSGGMGDARTAPPGLMP